MRVRDYLKEVNGDVTFIEVIAIRLDNSPFYNYVYRTTPIHQKYDWEESTSGILDALIVRKDCVPIDTTGTWELWHKQGRLKCCMIQREETLRKMYSEKQANDMIDYYERLIP